tara:strand:+ start:868 stop:978 length:111 start_codon:yes stop_codon:yes gene_type:complete
MSKMDILKCPKTVSPKKEWAKNFKNSNLQHNALISI